MKDRYVYKAKRIDNGKWVKVMGLDTIKEEYEQLLKVERELNNLAKRREKLENDRKNFAYNYRVDSVDRVLDFIRSEYRQGRLCDLEILLCHCQNKLNGNIDRTELTLDKGKPFEILKVGDSE